MKVGSIQQQTILCVVCKLFMSKYRSTSRYVPFIKEHMHPTTKTDILTFLISISHHTATPPSEPIKGKFHHAYTFPQEGAYFCSPPTVYVPFPHKVHLLRN